MVAQISNTQAAQLLDRDLSILAFNERVLSWAKRPDVPLLERLRYLCIVSSNLDEFFEVRMEPHVTATLEGVAVGAHSHASLQSITDKARQMVDLQYDLYNNILLPALEKHGYCVLSHGKRNAEQRRWVRSYFKREVQPLLMPVSLDPAHPFPQVANKSLNFIVHLSGKDAFGHANDIAIVKVPRVLPRLIPMPERICGGKTCFVLLSSVIRAHLDTLFPERKIMQFSQFRVTRNADLSVDEDTALNLRTALRQGLQHRPFGKAVRLEVSDDCSDHLVAYLRKEFQVPPASVFRVNGPVNLVRLMQLTDLVKKESLLFPPYKAAYPKELPRKTSIFNRLKKGEVLIHQPFESFDGVLNFLREAAFDEKVLAIKQTIYRTGSDPAMINLLVEAVRRGKEVTVVVELKARFDEEANINWAEQLEAVGVQVVYGVVGLKTHAKMLLVVRREGRLLKRYGHLSTGNYNPRTARLYTDLSYLTADTHLTADMDNLFVHLASQNRLPKLHCLLVAPFNLQSELVKQIRAVAHAATQGKTAKITAKMNALTDAVMVDALQEAARQGVQIELIVRGACILPGGNMANGGFIRIRSVIGRFLEHSRVFYFQAGETEQLLLSSADWMNRNLTRRIEVAWPIHSPSLRQRIVRECLDAYLNDAQDAWALDTDGVYQPSPSSRSNNKPTGTGQGAQAQLMAQYGGT